MRFEKSCSTRRSLNMRRISPISSEKAHSPCSSDRPTPTRLLAETLRRPSRVCQGRYSQAVSKGKTRAKSSNRQRTSRGICFSDDYYELQIQASRWSDRISQRTDCPDRRTSIWVAVNERHSNLLQYRLGPGSVALGKIVAEIGDARRFKNISVIGVVCWTRPLVVSVWGTSISGEHSLYQSKGLRSCVIPLYYAAVVAIQERREAQSVLPEEVGLEGMHCSQGLRRISLANSLGSLIP